MSDSDHGAPVDVRPYLISNTHLDSYLPSTDHGNYLVEGKVFLNQTEFFLYQKIMETQKMIEETKKMIEEVSESQKRFAFSHETYKD